MIQRPKDIEELIKAQNQVNFGGNYQHLRGAPIQRQTEGVGRQRADLTEENCPRCLGRGEKCVGGLEEEEDEKNSDSQPYSNSRTHQKVLETK